MNREDFTNACMAATFADTDYPLPGQNLARVALDLFYDKGRYQDRPDVAADIVHRQYLEYARECYSHFYNLRSRLPYGIDDRDHIRYIAYITAQDCFGRKEAFTAISERIDRMIEEHECYLEVRAETRRHLLDWSYEADHFMH